MLLQGQSLLIRLLLPRPHGQGFRLFLRQHVFREIAMSLHTTSSRQGELPTRGFLLPISPIGNGFSVPTSVQDSGRLVRNPPLRQSRSASNVEILTPGDPLRIRITSKLTRQSRAHVPPHGLCTPRPFTSYLGRASFPSPRSNTPTLRHLRLSSRGTCAAHTIPG
jgi:hypothetical protein